MQPKEIAPVSVVSLFLVFLALLYIDIVAVELIPVIAIALVCVSLLIYVNYHHRIRNYYKKQTLSIIFGFGLFCSLIWGVVILTTGSYTLWQTPYIATLGDGTGFLPDSFLPSWWMVTLLTGIFLVIIYDVYNYSPVNHSYSRISFWEDLPRMPILLGVISAVLGLWGMLFIIAGEVQRIVVVAPIFEELLKFGLAIFLGTALFGRRLLSRVAIGFLIGVLFGVSEHFLTYSAEPDTVYLFRVFFHGMTASLSVAIFVKFEQYDFYHLMWTAPLLSIGFHFMHNAFAVATSILFHGTAVEFLLIIPILFGSLATTASFITILLTLSEHEIILDFHESIYHFGKL